MEQSYLKNSSYQLEVNGEKKELTINRAYCIGYTGRDRDKTLEHIKELAEIGVPEPTEVPSLYPVGVSNLNQEEVIEVIGGQTSGEAEIVLIFGESEDECFLSVGSDHTDRSLETVDINKSKQVCDKPFAKKAWVIGDVIDHWDQLELSSEVSVKGKWQPYQKNAISAIISLDNIKAYLKKKEVPLTYSIVFSGTVPLVDGFKFGEKFRMTLSDPVNEDTITAEYEIKNLIN
ncbi:DUF2848 family protein [Virgibacillus sp. C22-A2]|uniref:DUF2848 family protein n=1 Tax=Virgibacillus tibetensis TaxID=3042313 RepID=A0ABU6KFX8_9BACI|nr:DUF2848 family protein [Virgibacillus sp. C22-A2]